jgi:hypothetical protein
MLILTRAYSSVQGHQPSHCGRHLFQSGLVISEGKVALFYYLLLLIIRQFDLSGGRDGSCNQGKPEESSSIFWGRDKGYSSLYLNYIDMYVRQVKHKFDLNDPH